MCGIGGVLQNSKKKINFSHLKKTKEILHHRGPDASGIWINKNKNIGLVHTRLSIIDLSKAGNQPMQSKNKRFHITYNGEIYNHLKIREELEKKLKKKIKWKSNCDTETLLECISKFGIDYTLDLVSGMFAFAVWDELKQELFICRDRFGEKPLYYGWINNNFYFFSELEPFYKIADLKNDICKEALDIYLKFMYVPYPYSIFKNIYKLNPGHYLKVKKNHNQFYNCEQIIKSKYNKNGIEVKQWFSVSKIINKSYKKNYIKNKNSIISSCEEKLKKSILEQTISDRPIGVFLSGGIDSSLVASILQKNSKNKINTFSIGFKEKLYDESYYSDLVANHLSTKHYNFTVTFKDLLRVVNKMPLIYDEPFADSSQIPTAILCKKTKKYVDVVLTGDGADELFAGYNRYVYSQKIFNLINYFPKFSFFLIYQFLNFFKKFIFFKKVHNLQNKIDKVLNRINFLDKDVLFFKSFLYEIYNKSLVKGFEEKNKNYKFLNKNLSNIKRKDFLSKMIYIDQKNYLTDDILCKVDRSAMYYSLETRAPFLNKNLFEFSWNLNNFLKVSKNGLSKKILRDVLSKYVPKEILNRPKMGFGIPLAEWLRGPLKFLIEKNLNKPVVEKQNLFSYPNIRNIIDQHQKNKKNNANTIWALIMFQLWYKKL